MEYLLWALFYVLFMCLIGVSYYTSKVSKGCPFSRLIDVLFVDPLEDTMLRCTFWNIFALRILSLLSLVVGLSTIGVFVWIQLL